MVAATLGTVVGVGTLAGILYAVAAVFDSLGPVWFVTTAAVVGVVQLATGVLMIVGAARLAGGRGRGVFLAGIALEFLLCAVHALNALILVAGDPDDAGVVWVFLLVPSCVAVLVAGSLFLSLRPAATAFLSRGTRPSHVVAVTR